MKDHKQRFQVVEDTLMQTPQGERRDLWANTDPATEPVPGPYRPSGFATLDAIAEASRARFLYGGNQPTTHTDSGTIELPEPERFCSSEDYARTVAHELAHWTGWPGELGRPTPYTTEFRQFLLGAPPVYYAREEMAAELGAALILDAAGVPHDLAYSSGYYAGWREAHAQDPQPDEAGTVEEADAWARARAEEAAELLLNRAGM